MRPLIELERLRDVFDLPAAARKLALLEMLSRARFPSAASLLRWHECLCFLRAYPDDARILARVRRELARFAARPDLRRRRAELENSGIAGTDIAFRFFQPTAAWLGREHPRALWIDWAEFEASGGAERLERLLPDLLPWAETQNLDDEPLSVRARIERLRGPQASDAAFVAGRLDALAAPRGLKRHLYDELDPPLVLRAGRSTPSRTLAEFPVEPWFQVEDLHRGRPELARAVREPPLHVRELAAGEGDALVRLAREAMAVRARDLDAFMYADARDARWIDCGDGLAFACLGVVPEERLLLEGVYAFLTLRNGVPIGYVLASSLWGSCEVAYNVFETFRGGEAAWIYGRVLATLRVLFAADTFTVYPYQLGHENEEGVRSGAWWFYQKLGFRPRDAATLALMRREQALQARTPAHRSSPAVLRRLARENVYWSLGAPRQDVIGRFPAHVLGSKVSAHFARRFGSDRERGVEELGREVAAALRIQRHPRWPADELRAFERWVPLLALIDDLARWSARDKAALVHLVRAKGGRREIEFVHAFDAHVGLRRELCRLAGVRGAHVKRRKR